MGGRRNRTEERVADVLGDLVPGLARLGEVQKLATEHPFELIAQQTPEQTSRTHHRTRRPIPLTVSLTLIIPTLIDYRLTYRIIL